MGTVLLSIILVIGIAVFALWDNEISTVASIDMLIDANQENACGAIYS